MEEQNDDIQTMKDNLEEEELTSTNGIASVTVYKKLLVIYLIENDLPNAKFLWKRIPQELKIDNELTIVWKIGQYLWNREFPNVHATIIGQEWSPEIKELMEKLQSNLQCCVTKLITDAYSVIRFNDLSKLLGLNDDETKVIEYASLKGWTIDFENKLVKLPDRNDKITLGEEITSEQLLYRLTNYVSFMEN